MYPHLIPAGRRPSGRGARFSVDGVRLQRPAPVAQSCTAMELWHKHCQQRGRDYRTDLRRRPRSKDADIAKRRDWLGIARREV